MPTTPESEILRSGNMVVTTARVSFHGESYFLRNINGAAIRGFERPWVKPVMYTFLFLVVWPLVGGLVAIYANSGLRRLACTAAWGVLFAGTWLFCRWVMKHQWDRRLVLSTSTGEVHLASGTLSWLQEVKSAIEDGIGRLQ